MPKRKKPLLIRHEIKLVVITEGFTKKQVAKWIENNLFDHVLAKRYVGFSSHTHSTKVIDND